MIHKTLSKEKWFNFSLFEQLGNIGAEYNRFAHWREENDEKNANGSFERMLELIDLTIEDPKWRSSLKEILRLREAVCSQFAGTPEFKISTQTLQNYFLQFALVARR